ncbi:MAG: NmrA family NAD(P)-binding protein [Chloroflexi bacterium]|nr:NmrA family NAD(P)-binding protein [Chloroflexota bacterium]
MFVMIAGGGKVGAHLAELLIAEGYRVRLVEQRRERAEALLQEFPAELIAYGSASDPVVLEAAGIRQANVVAAVTGDDQTNLVIASLARFEFGVPRIIGRVNNPKNAWLYTPTMGVDVALSQADFMAHLIAEEMSLGDMMTLIKLRQGQFSLVQEKVHPESEVFGKQVKDVSLPVNVVLVAILRKGEMLIPKGTTVFQEADEVIALVHSSSAAALNALLSFPH